MIMCCGRGGDRKRERWIVTMPNGTEVPKDSQVQAENYSRKHPGSTIRKAEVK